MAEVIRSFSDYLFSNTPVKRYFLLQYVGNYLVSRLQGDHPSLKGIFWNILVSIWNECVHIPTKSIRLWSSQGHYYYHCDKVKLKHLLRKHYHWASESLSYFSQQLGIFCNTLRKETFALNSFMTEVPIIEKPGHCFSEKISGLVSIW